MTKKNVGTKLLIIILAMMLILSLTVTDISLAASGQTDGVNLVYSTFFGGSKAEEHTKLALDSEGNIIIAGVTHSEDFETTMEVYNPDPKPYNDAKEFYVTKISEDGKNVIWSTKLGQGNDVQPSPFWYNYELDIEIDSLNNIVIVGSTDNINFPTTPSALDKTLNGRDVFISILSSDGKSLLYSTFLGGSDDEWGLEVELDSNDNIYVAGFTESSDFPVSKNAYDNTLGGFRDFFVTKFSHDGSEIKYSTFIGGSDQEDLSISLLLDDSNNAYITGQSRSSDFPIVNGFDSTYNGIGNSSREDCIKIPHSCYLFGDGVIVKLSSDGSEILYSSFLGGSRDDSINNLLLDEENNLILVGSTNSVDFPITNDALKPNIGSSILDNDVFITKISSNGSDLIYSTYFGGNYYDNPEVKAFFDNSKRLIFPVSTYCENFPTTSNSFQPTISAGPDGALVILSSDLKSIEYSTFIGGELTERMFDLQYDPINDVIYYVGDSNSRDFPIIGDALKFEKGFDLDAVITKWQLGEVKNTEVPQTGYIGLEILTFTLISMGLIKKHFNKRKT